MSQEITFKIITIKSKDNVKSADNPNLYKEKEDIVAENQGGQKLYLTRFRHAGEIPLVTADECEKKKVGAVYRATLKPKRSGSPYNDTIEEVHWIGEWDGVESPFFPTPDSSAADDREAHFTAFGDLHGAASLYGNISSDFTDDQVVEELKRLARLFRRAHEELKAEYLKETK